MPRLAINALTFAAVAPPDLKDFDYMFPTLQNDPNALLPESAQTVVALRSPAATMVDDKSGPNSTIPAAYTYFGQFATTTSLWRPHPDRRMIRWAALCARTWRHAVAARQAAAGRREPLARDLRAQRRCPDQS